MHYNIVELISEKELQNKVVELADRIKLDYKDSKALIFIGVLRGSMIFLADLLRKVNLNNATVDFIFVSSYGNSTKSSASVKIVKDLEENIEGKDVIIVEDIMDTTLTIKEVYNLFMQRKPKSLKVCVLLNKPSKNLTNFNIDYLGFNIEDNFVVGYGIDYAQKYRGLPYIAKVVFKE